MRKVINLGLTLLLLAVLVHGAVASSFKILGTRPLGMGGAFVAVAEDAIAQYWNPAGFALQKGLDIQIPVGLGMETTAGLLKEVEDLGDKAEKFAQISEDIDKGTVDPTTIKEFTSVLNEIDDLNKSGMGLILDVNLGFNVRFRNLGLGVINTTELGADPDFDLYNIGLASAPVNVSDALDALCLNVDPNESPPVNGDGPGGLVDLTSAQKDIADDIADALDDLGANPSKSGWDNKALAEELVTAGVLAGLSDSEIRAVGDSIVEMVRLMKSGYLTGGSFDNNQTRVRINGISLFEVPLTYARELPWVKNLYLGANLKFMYGTVGFFQFDVFQDEDLLESIYEDYKDYYKTSSTIGLDIGALYDLREKLGLRFGMVVKNLNYPSFGQPDKAKEEAKLEKYTIQPQVRVGVAYWPVSFITLSADLDLTNNKTALSGYMSRMFGVGGEINLLNKKWLNLALRAGYMDNLSEKYGGSFTTGLGLNLFHFQLDFAGAVSTETTKIGGDKKFPTSAFGSFTLSFNF